MTDENETLENTEPASAFTAAVGSAFQYYREGKMIEDTALITREEADSLWDEHLEDFKSACKRGDDAEIALWVNMEYEGNYQETGRRHSSQDVCIDESGRFFEKVYF